MSNLITEIYDKQAVVDNLNQLGELINSSLNAIVASAPKLQSPIEYLTAVQSISEIEKKNTEVTQAKAKAMSTAPMLSKRCFQTALMYWNTRIRTKRTSSCF